MREIFKYEDDGTSSIDIYLEDDGRVVITAWDCVNPPSSMVIMTKNEALLMARTIIAVLAEK